MATKSIKSAGKILISGFPVQYWQNAAKQIEWPVDIVERYISVPEDEIQSAKDNLMVHHFLNNGFFIQSAIPERVSKTKIFDPEIILKVPVFKITEPSQFNLFDRFKIQSSCCELEITSLEPNKVHLKYINRRKPDLLISEDMLKSHISKGLWIKEQAA